MEAMISVEIGCPLQLGNVSWSGTTPLPKRFEVRTNVIAVQSRRGKGGGGRQRHVDRNEGSALEAKPRNTVKERCWKKR